MRILAIDTAFEACSAAILDGDRILWREQRLIGRGHSEILPVMAAAGFAATGFGVRDLDRIGVVIGPGAFAGIRVGLAFARALRLGFDAKVVGVTSLAALAASLDHDGTIAPIFDARRGQVYAGLNNRAGRVILAPFVATPHAAAARLAEAGPLALAGSGAALVAPHLAGAPSISARLHIDPVAVARLTRAAPDPAAPPAPLYLRPPDAAPSAGGLFDDICAS